MTSTLAIACGAMALIGAFGGVFEPFDFANQFAPLWLAVGLTAAAVAVLLETGRRRLFVLAAGMAILGLGGLRVAPELAAAFEFRAAPPAPAGALKIISFNVWKSDQDPAGTAAWILAQNADIVVLDDAALRGELVADALSAKYPFHVRCNAKRCSTMLLSRLAPVNSGGLAHGDPENRGGLSAAWATFVDARGPFTVVAVHLPRPWPFGDQRVWQERLCNAVAPLNHGRMIVAGDFNATPWSFALRRLDDCLHLQRRTLALPTWPARLRIGVPVLSPILPIDHIYADRSWETVSVRRGPSLGSDHYPVVIELRAP